MEVLDFFLVVAALSVAGVAIALIPTLLQIKRTAQKTELLVDTVNREAGPLLHTLAETATGLQSLTATLNQDLHKVEVVVDTVQQAGNLLVETTSLLRRSFLPLAAQVGGIGAGVKAFIQYLCR